MMIDFGLWATLIVLVANAVVVCAQDISGYNGERFRGEQLAQPSSTFETFDSLLAKARPNSFSRSSLSESNLHIAKNAFLQRESARKSVHAHFQQTTRAKRSSQHTVVIAVELQNVDYLEDVLKKISDPFNAEFGSWWSTERLRETVKNPSGVAAIIEHVRSLNLRITHRSLFDEFITVEGEIQQLEKLLNTEFFEFQHKEHKQLKVVRSLSYSLPSHLSKHILAVFNTTHFPTETDLMSKIVTSKFPHSQFQSVDLQTTTIPDFVTPALINSVYNVRNNTGNHLASQGVYETIGQTYSPADLKLFQRKFALPQEEVAQVIGGHNDDQTCYKNGGNDCAEANLDIQYMMAMAQNVPSTYYYWSGRDFVLDWLMQVADMASPPQVFSISYGADESELPASYGEAFNRQAVLLSLRGVTIVVSSGDDGASSSAARHNSLRCGYAPSFPASSPYVVAVGGTMGPENGGPEVACQGDLDGQITSGGGFSTMFSRPDWQESALSAYFDRMNDDATIDAAPGFARSGRGLPDISLLARKYVIALAGNFTAVSGTSASSPVFAGMISLVNSKRLAAGKPALGWITPHLYTYASSFVKDVTSGHNKCVAGASVCCAQGFHATTGWDAVTGLGSVDYTAFESVMFALGDGSGSSTPTTEPVRVPSFQPSQAPTTASGWMYLQEYTAESCTGKIATISGVPTNKCMIEYSGSEMTVVGSRMFSCTEYFAEVSYFNSTDCSDGYLGNENFYFGCAYQVENYYYSSDYHSVSVQCSESGGIIPPLPSYDGSYVLNSNYDSLSGCEVGMESSVDGKLQNYCFNIASEEFSYKITFPKIYVYRSVNCHARDLQQTIPLDTQCTTVTDDNSRRLQDGGAYYYGPDIGSVELFSVWSKAQMTAPTRQPTLSVSSQTPSMIPTLFPTEVPSTFPTSSENGSSQQPVSESPTPSPTIAPVVMPSSSPSHSSLSSRAPSVLLSDSPISMSPSALPATASPTQSPSIARTTMSPSMSPELVTSAPSSVPPLISAAPTARPSLSSEVASSGDNIQITFSHTLSGISLAKWAASVASCVLVFQEAMLELFPFLSGSDLVITSVVDRESTLQSVFLQGVAGIDLVYQLHVDLRKHNFPTSGDAFTFIHETLTMAVSSGDFSSYLHHYATANNVAVMSAVESGDVQVLAVDLTGASESPSANVSGSMATTKQIGIAIAVVLVVLIIIIIACCVRNPQKASSKYSEVAMDSDSTHHSALPAKIDGNGFSKVTGTTDDDEDMEIELATISPLQMDVQREGANSV